LAGVRNAGRPVGRVRRVGDPTLSLRVGCENLNARRRGCSRGRGLEFCTPFYRGMER
jgi:hypothetical protein